MKKYAKPSVKIVEVDPTTFYLMDLVSGVGDGPQYSKRRERGNAGPEDWAEIVDETELEIVDN